MVKFRWNNMLMLHSWFVKMCGHQTKMTLKCWKLMVFVQIGFEMFQKQIISMIRWGVEGGVTSTMHKHTWIINPEIWYHLKNVLVKYDVSGIWDFFCSNFKNKTVFLFQILIISGDNKCMNVLEMGNYWFASEILRLTNPNFTHWLLLTFWRPTTRTCHNAQCTTTTTKHKICTDLVKWK